MSENGEIVRALNDAMWVDHDIDAALALVDPDADFDWLASRAPYRGTFKGHAELTRFFEQMQEAWEEWIPTFEEVIDLDPETVLIVTLVRARGRGSGVPVEARGASVWSVREGKVAGAKLYQSKEEALEALGITA
jgi:ketosteroid isomerase-like protein